METTMPRASSLGDLEKAVLETLSSSTEALSVREIQTRLEWTEELAYTTVLTVLDRLHGKKLVSREKRSRSFYYQPLLTADEWRGRQAGRLIAGRDDPPNRAVLVAFLESAAEAAPEVLGELTALLEERKKAKRKR
jgi:predicted transcriptional regulator